MGAIGSQSYGLARRLRAVSQRELIATGQHTGLYRPVKLIASVHWNKQPGIRHFLSASLRFKLMQFFFRGVVIDASWHF